MKPTKPAQLGTDEAFWQFMTISGKSLLKLFGLSDQEAASYRFQATILKEKKLQPDVQGISSLACSQGRFFMEFQGYEDPFIRYRAVAEAFWGCSFEQYEGPIRVCIVYTDPKYQQVALPLELSTDKTICRLTHCVQELVLPHYTEAKLVQVDPKLVVLAPFTVPAKTPKATLLAKGAQWQQQVTQVYPKSQQRVALNALGLFLLNQFRQVSYQEVRTMFNLDLSKSLAVQQLMQQARQETALAKDQEYLLETLDERFGQIPKRLSNQIRAIVQPNVLKQLHRQAIRCQDLDSFQEQLPKAPKVKKVKKST